jgi:hypothetical protein
VSFIDLLYNSDMESNEPDPVSDGDLIIELWNLCERIRNHGGKPDLDSMAERYKYFVENSEHGKDCSYARKCRDLFERHDYEDVKKQFLLVASLWKNIDKDIT